jgi:hypothetical protein
MQRLRICTHVDNLSSKRGEVVSTQFIVHDDAGSPQ